MPTDLLPDRFTEAARLMAEGLTPARAWEVVQKYCSPQCLLAWGDGEHIHCSCRCQEAFGTMLHGYFRNHLVDCVARPPRDQPAPAPEDHVLLGTDYELHPAALPEAGISA